MVEPSLKLQLPPSYALRSLTSHLVSQLRSLLPQFARLPVCLRNVNKNVPDINPSAFALHWIWMIIYRHVHLKNFLIMFTVFCCLLFSLLFSRVLCFVLSSLFSSLLFSSLISLVLSCVVLCCVVLSSLLSHLTSMPSSFACSLAPAMAGTKRGIWKTITESEGPVLLLGIWGVLSMIIVGDEAVTMQRLPATGSVN